MRIYSFFNNTKLFCFSLWITVCFCEIVYQLDVTFEDNVFESKLKVCSSQRPIDAISDFLLISGIHENYVTDYHWTEQIYEKVCTDTMLCNALSSSDKIASRFLSQKNPTSHVIWNGDTSNPFIFILREGYNSSQTANCICSKVHCTSDDVQILITLIDDEIASRIKDNEMESKQNEATQFNSDNHYVTLGLITSGAEANSALRESAMSLPDSALKQAYQTLARRYHPDKHHKASEEELERVTEIFRKIHTAYETLSDADMRRQHELSLGWRQQHTASHLSSSSGSVHLNVNGVNIHFSGGFGYTIVFG